MKDEYEYKLGLEEKKVKERDDLVKELKKKVAEVEKKASDVDKRYDAERKQNGVLTMKMAELTAGGAGGKRAANTDLGDKIALADHQAENRIMESLAKAGINNMAAQNKNDASSKNRVDRMSSLAQMYKTITSTILELKHRTS